MSQVPSTQPLSRRERHAMEQGETPNLLRPAAPEPLAQEPPAPPLSRREMRLLEAGEGRSVPSQGRETPQSSFTVAPASVALPPVFGLPSTITGADAIGDLASVVSPMRRVGDISTATHSLIIPQTPTIDIAGPLGDTGEVVVTGQIRLPSSVSERGTIPSIAEDRDDDEAMDGYDTGMIAASAKPLRASQAVSSKGDDSDIVLVRRARWGTAAIVASLGAAVLGLAAVALLILAVMTDVLG